MHSWTIHICVIQCLLEFPAFSLKTSRQCSSLVTATILSGLDTLTVLILPGEVVASSTVMPASQVRQPRAGWSVFPDPGGDSRSGMAPDTLTTNSFICSGDYYSISFPSLWIIFFFLVSCDEETFS